MKPSQFNYNVTKSYFYNNLNYWISKFNRTEIIEALTYMELIFEDFNYSHSLLPKIKKIEEKYQEFRLDFVCESESESESDNSTIFSSEVSRITDLSSDCTESTLFSDSVSLYSSEVTSDSDSVEIQIENNSMSIPFLIKNTVLPDNKWKFKTNHLNGIDLQNQEISFTGDLEFFGRDELITFIEDNNGIPKKWITTNTDLVIYGSSNVGEKFYKAIKNRIKIMSETEWIEYLEKLKETNFVNFLNNEKKSKLIIDYLKNDLNENTFCDETNYNKFSVDNKYWLNLELNKNKLF